MGIKRSIEIAAEVLAVKPSRLQAMATMQQAERMTSADAVMQQVERLQQEIDLLLQEAERLRAQEVRPATHKGKRGKQALRGRTRVERVRPAVEVEVEEELSWGYVQPDGTVTAHCDSFTIGVVVDSGAEVECPDLPRYYFRYVEGGRNYRVIRK